MKKLLLLAIVVLGLSAVSFGQTSVSDQASATATVLVPISITNDTPLIFGSFAQDAGTVTIAPDGERTSVGVNLYTVAGVTPSAASFTVEGDGTSSFSIDLPNDGVVNLTRAGGGTMAVSAFLSDPAEGTSALVDGEMVINVGATITVDAEQTVGVYNGEFTVTVNYN